MPQREPGMSLSGLASGFPALQWPGRGGGKLFLFPSGNDDHGTNPLTALREICLLSGDGRRLGQPCLRKPSVS